MWTLSWPRHDVLGRWTGGVDRDVPAPARDDREIRLDHSPGDIEDDVQVLLTLTQPRDGEPEDTAVAVPGGLVEPRGVPGDVRDRAPRERPARRRTG